MIFRRRNREDSHNRARRPFLLLVPFLLTIWLLSIVPGLQPAQPVTADNGTTITLESAVTEINGCETLDLYIRINDVTNLYGADVRLAFDPAVLEVYALQELDGILQSPYYIARKEWDNTAGTLWLALTQLSPTLPVTGTGDFARVTFRAAGAAIDSPVTISYSKLSNPNGVEIPATRIDGSLTTIAPPAPAVAIEILNPTTPRLSWTAVSGVDGYNVYRDTYAYFTPDLPYAEDVTDNFFDDEDALGGVEDNYFYVIRSACDNGFESANANRVGEFDFELVTDPSLDKLNMIALPLDSTVSISPFKASGLAAYVGPGVKQVLKWNASVQNFDTHFPGVPFEPDFDLTIGGLYGLVIDDTPANILTFVGDVPSQGSISFSFLPGTASVCSLNSLSIPLDRIDITRASELAADIGGVTQVLAWNPAIQNFNTFFPDFDTPGSSLDFATHTGYPFFVCLTDAAPVSWP